MQNYSFNNKIKGKIVMFKSLSIAVSMSMSLLFSATSFAVTTDEGIDKTFSASSSGGTVPSAAVGTPFTTLFAADNSFAGNTFDLQVIGGSPIKINGFDVNLDSQGSTNTVSLYMREGTSVGVENTPGEWVLVGTDSGVISAGVDAPSHVDISNIILQPGTTYGFYIDLASYPSSSFLYTNGGPNVFSDANLQLTTNTGQGSPAFSGSFFPRQVNTTIYYDIAVQEVPALSSNMLILVSLLLAGVGIIAVRKMAKS